MKTPKDPLIIVAKNVKGDTLKNPSTIINNHETPVNRKSFKKMESSFLSWEPWTLGVFLIKWKVIENMTMLKIIWRTIGSMKVAKRARWLTRKHLLPPYPKLTEPISNNIKLIATGIMGKISEIKEYVMNNFLLADVLAWTREFLTNNLNMWKQHTLVHVNTEIQK